MIEDLKLKIEKLVDSLAGLFNEYQPKIVLNGHSGGGSFIFGYLDIVEKIPLVIYGRSEVSPKFWNWIPEKLANPFATVM